MNTLYSYLLVFLGAGIGGAIRHAVNRSTPPFGSGFPWTTVVVNVTGSLLMGIIAGWFAFRVNGGHHLSAATNGLRGQHFRLFLTTGILGGYTTFSAFSLDVALLWERGRMAWAIGYVSASVILSIAALLLGIVLVRP